MYIGRKPDGSVYAAWTMKQPNDADHQGMEEVADDHPDLLAFINRPLPVAPPDPIDELRVAMKANPAILNSLKAVK